VVYSGKTVIGKGGTADVTLPDYFDDLSHDPRIQLTGVGTYEVFVAEEVAGNSFVVGGRPDTRVFWTVTAERDDPKARLERVQRPVEQAKGAPGLPPVGQYISPECYAE